MSFQIVIDEPIQQAEAPMAYGAIDLPDWIEPVVDKIIAKAKELLIASIPEWEVVEEAVTLAFNTWVAPKMPIGRAIALKYLLMVVREFYDQLPKPEMVMG